MDASYLSQQVTTIINQLHGFFDEIGLPSHDRDSREAELFSALSDTLNNQLKLVASEKHELTEQARQLITSIRQMEASLDDSKPRDSFNRDDDDLGVTYPLLECVNMLKQKQKTVAKLHRERYDQVKQLADALNSYASHMESSFLSIKLPPTSPNSKISTTFDISPTYVTALDQEFTRVYNEYNRRISAIQSIAQEIISLWLELGIPQAQHDSAIVQNYRDTPEQLGLQQEDICRLESKREKLLNEKALRENKLADMRSIMSELWNKLEIDDSHRKTFLTSNRGCDMRVLNEYEDELSRLNMLKAQNLGIFIDKARDRLQGLQDSLFFSEDEMLEFTPMFTDIISEALLSAHEAEIVRLEALKRQRAPILDLVVDYRKLIKERDDLIMASQDSSRLLAKGKGARNLLTEEKTRKRIARELPKLENDLKRVVGTWEEEYGRPFNLQGHRFLDEIGTSSGQVKAAPTRSKTPSIASTPNAVPNTVRATTSTARGGTVRATSQHRSKTPIAASRSALASSVMSSTSSTMTSNKASTMRYSPSKIPGRQPLGFLGDGKNSPERRPKSAAGHNVASRDEQNFSASVYKTSPSKTGANNRAATMKVDSTRIPPPKMQDIFPPTPTPSNYSTSSDHSSVIVRHVDLEDVYDDRSYRSHPNAMKNVPQYFPGRSASVINTTTRPPHTGQTYPMAPSIASRQTSNHSSISQGSHLTSASTANSSENWETYTNASDDERAGQTCAASKRSTPDDGLIDEKFDYKKSRDDNSMVRGGMPLGITSLRMLQAQNHGLGIKSYPGRIEASRDGRERELTADGSDNWTETDDGDVF